MSKAINSDQFAVISEDWCFLFSAKRHFSMTHHARMEPPKSEAAKIETGEKTQNKKRVAREKRVSRLGVRGPTRNTGRTRAASAGFIIRE